MIRHQHRAALLRFAPTIDILKKIPRELAGIIGLGELLRRHQSAIPIDQGNTIQPRLVAARHGGLGETRNSWQYVL